MRNASLNSNVYGFRTLLAIFLLFSQACVQDAIVMAGSDVQGAQYALYDYCTEVLRVYPYEYRTGNTTKPLKLPDLSISENKVISPPEIPILCYFENDVNELANLKSKF